MHIIGPSNMGSMDKLNNNPVPNLGHLELPPTTALQCHHLPGDIIITIHSGARKRGTGDNADSIDMFIDLDSLNIAEMNEDIR